uniref:FAD-binding PCMH-type domain-containing protein n=1 Tax=Rhodosorus marinus TaxID=101924 RepID=A0A7S3A8I2_9RHOD|mmetsp:Transcript_4986/g.21540  ORF Transcript_4986/g.21540 Transcript_4986/m.21540 type:complete len:175 (+) Transcript_4986:240-764(+)
MRATEVRSAMTGLIEQARRASSVVAVKSQVELCELVKYCNDIGQRIRTTAFGAADERDALQVDLSGLNRWVEKHDDDMDLRVECGVTRENLLEKLPETGLFFPMANRHDLSIGDVVNANIPNPGSAKYNSPRTNVLGLTIVSATGELFRTGTRARKSSAGGICSALVVVTLTAF